MTAVCHIGCKKSLNRCASRMDLPNRSSQLVLLEPPRTRRAEPSPQRQVAGRLPPVHEPCFTFLLHGVRNSNSFGLMNSLARSGRTNSSDEKQKKTNVEMEIGRCTCLVRVPRTRC